MSAMYHPLRCHIGRPVRMWGATTVKIPTLAKKYRTCTLATEQSRLAVGRGLMHEPVASPAKKLGGKIR